MRVFVSSTFEDLAEYRTAAIRALRELGHDVVAMEEFTAASLPPLQTVRERLRRCDAYIGIFGWRYGFIPDEPADLELARSVEGLQPHGAGGDSSITHLEYLFAREKDLPVLAFLLDESVPWPPGRADAFRAVEDQAHMASATAIRNLRRQLQRERVVAYFDSPADLGQRVATAVTNLGVGRRVFRNLVRLTTPVPVPDSDIFGGIHNEIRDASTTGRRVSTIELPGPDADPNFDAWWSTRLFLLALLAQEFTSIERIAVVDSDPTQPGTLRFVGMLSTSSVVRTLAHDNDNLKNFQAEVRRGAVARLDQEEALEAATAAWNASIIDEQGQKYFVTKPNLVTWFGDSLFTSAVGVDDVRAPTLLDIVRILEYPNDFVPVGLTRSGDGGDGDDKDGAADPGGDQALADGRPPSEWKDAPVTLIDKRAMNDQLAEQYLDELMDRARLR
jgi:hypothetical protein